MRKLIFLCHRRPDVTHERYTEQLLRSHVPIALRHHPALRRYVVNEVTLGLLPGPRELDSIGELSFATLDDYRERLYDSPEGRRVVSEDVAKFIGGADAYDCTEHVRKGADRPGPYESASPAPSPGAKLVLCLKRKPGMTHEAFVEHWLGTHAALVLEHGARLAKYVQNVVDGKLSPEAIDYDGFAELHFASDDDFLAQMASHSQGPNPVQEDTANFVGEMAVWRVAEHVAKIP
ncbi:MAG: EthD domain-containing protein [Thermodesulfobacteriota bacterium]